MATLKNVFSTTITDFFVNQVASQLSEWLQNNKDVDVTAEELCSAFGLTYTPRTNMAGLPQSASMPTQMPNLPGYFQGTGASPAAEGKSGKGSGRGGGGGRKKAAPADPNGPKCIYSFQRGNKKGGVCGDAVAGPGTPGGDEYCKNCLKKKTVQTRVTTGSGGRSTVQPPVVPNGMVSVNDDDDEDEDGDVNTGTDNTINVVPIQGSSNMFKELNHGFILRQEHDGTVVALAVEENGVQRNLTADEKKTAQSLGLSFVDTPQKGSTTQSVATIPTVPTGVPSHTIPTIPSVPQVPQLSQ
jgi:hypothetical protein